MQNYKYIAVAIATISALSAWMLYKPVQKKTQLPHVPFEHFDEAKYLNNTGVQYAREGNLVKALEFLNLGH